MSEDFDKLLNEIKGLLQEKDRVLQVLERAHQERESVRETVLRRVLTEYREKWNSLYESAQPLIKELGDKIEEMDNHQKSLEAARLGMEERVEEVEFRYKIGDMEEEAYLEKKQSTIEELESIKAELDDLDKELTDYKRALETLKQPLPEELQAFIGEIVGSAPSAPSAAGAPKGKSSEKKSMVEPDVVFTPRNAYLEMVADGSRFPLVPPVITLGRAKDNHIVLDDSRVSRYHGRIEIEGDFERIIYRDLGSSNGSFLNGRKIVESELKETDKLFLGSTELVVKVEQ